MTNSLPDLGCATASQLVQALAARDIGALELCDATIARIERLDAHINAVVVRDFDRARLQARAADAALSRGFPLDAEYLSCDCRHFSACIHRRLLHS